MQKYTNNGGVPLSVAVYLATDHYDYDPNSISATSLMKPIRQQVLPSRIPAESKDRMTEITSVVKSRTGTAIHDAIERAWTGGHYKESMLALGYPQKLIDRMVVNPVGELAPDAIPVYMEKRSFKEIMGVRISGKFDFVAEGRLEDFKSTSTFTWVNDVKKEDYQLQGSIYRWLNPDIITEDHMAIQFIFTDWMPGRAKADPLYPSESVKQQLIPLLSLADTEQFIKNKLTQMQLHKHAPEHELPLCTDKELWRREPQYKYYKNPQKLARSTKNFTSLGDANQRLAEDGHVGTVVTIPGAVTACKFCAAFPICTQKDFLIADGSLIL